MRALNDLRRPRAAALPLALLAHAASAAVNVATFSTTAFAGARADSSPQTVDLTAPAFSSVRVTGAVAPPQPQLVLFAVELGGAAPAAAQTVLMWCDDHIVIDLHGRGPVAYINYSFTEGSAPAPLRLEWINASPTPATLSLRWSGNATAPGPVPASALSDAVAPAEQARAALRERMAAPPWQWGTYSAASMGTHVLLPSAFALSVTLGQAQDGQLLGDIIVFRQADPAIVRVGGHGFDGSTFTELQVGFWKGVPCTTLLQTTVGAGGSLQLLATTNGTAQACAGLVLFVTFQYLWGRAGSVSVVAPGQHVRATAPGFPDTDVFAAAPSVAFPNSSGAYFALALEPGGVTGLSSGAPVPIADMATNIAAASAAHAARRARFPGDLADAYDAQQSIIAANTIFSPWEGVVTPVSRGWRRGGTDYVLFCWDNLFLAWMASIDADSKDIAYSNLIQIVLSRTMFGFVPNYHAGTHDTTDRSEPQIGALITLEVYKRWGDAWLVEKLFTSLLGWAEWVWTARTISAGGAAGPLVVLGSNNNAPADEGGIDTLSSAKLESGIDNGAAYDDLDGARDFDNSTGLMKGQFDVGASALFVSECDALIALAPVAGRADVVPLLQARRDAVAAAMSAVMYNEDEGVFENTRANLTFHKRRMPTAFYPLISGTPTPERAAAMMPLLTSPLGFCVNDTAFGSGDANSTFLLQFAQGSDQHALCASNACVADALNARFTWVRVEGLAQVASAPSPGRTTPLLLYRNATGSFATTASATPPAAGYELVRTEGHCFTNAAAGLVPLSLWSRRAADGDFVTCASAACAADAARSGFVELDAAMCYAFNATTVEQLPCRFGVNSVARSDPAFFDNK